MFGLGWDLGPPNRILFVPDNECIENFPFKIPMNKTNLVICSAISNASRLSIDSRQHFVENEQLLNVRNRIIRNIIDCQDKFLIFLENDSFHLVCLLRKDVRSLLLFLALER